MEYVIFFTSVILSITIFITMFLCISSNASNYKVCHLLFGVKKYRIKVITTGNGKRLYFVQEWRYFKHRYINRIYEHSLEGYYAICRLNEHFPEDFIKRIKYDSPEPYSLPDNFICFDTIEDANYFLKVYGSVRDAKEKERTVQK